jgi:hypothetical protein
MIIIELRTSLLPSPESTVSVNRGEERFRQIEEGTLSFTEQINKIENLPEIDIYFSDNTIDSDTSMTEELRLIVNNNGIKPMYHINNNYGKRNKGAGLIEMWKSNMDTILKYKWLLYFEPRTILKDNEFIKNCLFSPGNHFKVIENGAEPHFYTGLFMIETELLMKFCENSDLEYMVNSLVSIELYLKNFMDNNNHEYSKYKNKLNLIWHDVTQNRFIEF